MDAYTWTVRTGLHLPPSERLTRTTGEQAELLKPVDSLFVGLLH
jgi:hypothetical protein